MKLHETLGENIHITCTDNTEFYVYVLGFTSELDNEPDDNGNYGGAYISVRTLKPTKYFDVGGEFVVHEYEIKEIEIIGKRT